MTTYPTDIHSPYDSAPSVAGKYATCVLCGIQWQILSEVKTDAKGCPFCNADDSAVQIHDESETSG